MKDNDKMEDIDDMDIEKDTEIVKPIKKENLKKLFSFKGGFQDWILLVVLVFVLFMVWAYRTDINGCYEVIRVLNDSCIVWEGGVIAGYCGDNSCDRLGNTGNPEDEINCPADCTPTFPVNIT